MALLPSDMIGNNAPTRGMAISTQDSHRVTRTFTPYVYRGTGKDTITPNRKRGQVVGEHPDWCYCYHCHNKNHTMLASQGLIPTGKGAYRS